MHLSSNTTLSLTTGMSVEDLLEEDYLAVDVSGQDQLDRMFSGNGAGEYTVGFLVFLTRMCLCVCVCP